MNKKNLSVMMAVLAGSAMLCGCAKSTDESVSLENNEIPTMYSVLGDEKELTGQGASTQNGMSSRSLTYGNGDVSRDDAVNYILGLQDNNGYTIVDGSDDENDSATEMKIGAARDMGDGNLIIVSVDWQMGETVVEYQYGEGELTIY